MADAGPSGVVVGSTSGPGAVLPPTPAPGSDGAFDPVEARKMASALLSEPEEGSGGEQPPPAEVKTEPELPKPEPVGTEEELTKNWVRFRDQDRRLKERAAKFSEERKAYEEAKAKDQAEVTSFREQQEKAKKSPLAALQALGWSFEQLIDYVGKNGQIPQERIVNDLKLQFDEETKTIKQQLEEIKKEKEQAERGRQIMKYEEAVTGEVKTTLEQYPHLKRFADKFGMEKLLPKVFQQLHNEALKKNFLPPSAVMRSFEEELSMVAPIFGPPPAQGGAGSGPANPEAVKPQPRPAPLTNDDIAESSSGAGNDYDIDSLRRKAKAILAGG